MILNIIDKYSEMSVKKWNDSLQEVNENYRKMWDNLDIELFKDYINGNIEFLPDDINWIYPKKAV